MCPKDADCSRIDEEGISPDPEIFLEVNLNLRIFRKNFQRMGPDLEGIEDNLWIIFVISP